MLNIYSPRQLKELLERYNLKPQKKLGQNFLIDYNIAQKIASAALAEGETVVEIGPGTGALTLALAEKAKRVIALELDRKILPVLQEVTETRNNIFIVHGDAASTDFDRLVERVADAKAVAEGYNIAANLPYYVATKIIMHLLEHNFHIRKLVFMVQREVAERLLAKPGSKDYGSLSVAVQFYARPTVVIPRVFPTVFFPRPAVESTVISLDVHQTPPVSVSDKGFFLEVVRASFAKRRKTIANALTASSFSLNKDQVIRICNESGIDPAARAEELSLEEYVYLSENILEAVKRDLGEGEYSEI